MSDAPMIDTRDDIKLSNAQIAWRAAQDIADGAYVNLGIGFPEMVAKFQPKGREAIFHTENGVLNFGEAPPPGEEDWDLINAGKKAITLKPGAAFFHHADSFAMVRGRASGCGDPWGPIRSLKMVILPIGVSAPRACLPWVARWILSMAQNRWWSSPSMSPRMASRNWSSVAPFPLTGVGCITRVYTSHAVIDIVNGKFVVREKLAAMTMEELQAMTGAKLHIDGHVDDLVVPAL